MSKIWRNPMHEVDPLSAHLVRHPANLLSSSHEAVFAIFDGEKCAGTLGRLEGKGESPSIKPKIQPVIQAGVTSHIQIRLNISYQPFTPFGYATMLMTRRWNKQLGQWQKLDPELDAIDYATVPDVVSARQAIAADKGRPVKIEYIDSSETFGQALNALKFITDDPTHPRREFLLGNSPMTLKRNNLFLGIAVPESYCDDVGFNTMQAEAFYMLRSLSGGVGLIHGPSGTGKSFWLIHALLPIVGHVVKTPNDRKQVMLVGPNNEVFDELSIKMSQAVKATFPSAEILVVRCHSMATEESIVRNHASMHRQPEHGARPPILSQSKTEGKETANEDSIVDLITTYLLTTGHGEETATQGGVADKRLKEFELSLGYRMLQLSGIVQASFSDPDKYKPFRTMFQNYLKGMDMDTTAWQDFNTVIRTLRDDVIQRADVLVCTTLGASYKPVRETSPPG